MSRITLIIGVVIGFLSGSQTDIVKSYSSKQEVYTPGKAIYAKGVKGSYHLLQNWITIMEEDFESGVMPTGWTVIDGNGDGFTWEVGTTTDPIEPPDPGSAYLFYSDDDAGSSSPATAETLITTSYYISGFSDLRFRYGFMFNDYEGEEGYILARFHDGTSWGGWNLLVTYIGDVGPDYDTLGMGAFLPAESVQIMIIYDDIDGGWGWGFGLDNFVLEGELVVNRDVGVSAIPSPSGTILIGDPVDVIVTVESNGQTQDTFDIWVEITDPFNNQVFYRESLDIVIDPGASIDVNFGQWIPNTEGTYNITAWVFIPNDEYAPNDTLSQNFDVSVWSSWISYTAPSTGADRLTHATIYDPDNDKIYMIGGTPDGTSGSNVPDVYRYDPVTDTWETALATLSVARGWIQGAYSGGKLYVASGYDNSGSAYNIFEIYDIATNTWTTGPNLPQARIAHGTVAFEDYIYIIGGIDASLSNGTQTVFMYDIIGDVWTDITSTAQLPMQFDMGGVTILDSIIYIVGGVERSSNNAWANLYGGVINSSDPTIITWTDLGPLPYPNAINAACALPGKIYMIGGFQNLSTATNQVWEYDVALGTWTQLPDYPFTIVRNHFAVGRPATGGDQNRIYVVAGDANGDWSPPNNYYYYIEGLVSVEEKVKTLSGSEGLFFTIKNSVTHGPIVLKIGFDRKRTVDIGLYSISGRRVATIFKGTKNKGTHVITWNGGLPAGVYFIKINGLSVPTAKVILSE
jgi:N-acetylneuraminic acid mutarotase